MPDLQVLNHGAVLAAVTPADAIAHVAGRPAHVHLGDLLIQPTRQAVGA